MTSMARSIDPNPYERDLRLMRQERDEAEHRFVNSLQSILSYVRLKRRDLEDGAGAEVLVDVERRIEGIARLHARINEADEDDTVDLDDFMAELGHEIELALGIDCRVECPSLLMDGRSAGLLSVVLNEMATNAAKYAWPDGETGTMTFACTVDDDMLRVRISDGGCGLPQSFRLEGTPSGLGMSLIAATLDQLGATMTAGNENGAEFLIELPAP